MPRHIRAPRGSRRVPQYPNLATYIAETGERQIDIAAAVGTSQAHLSRIVHADVVPRSQLAARLARYAHIPLDSFTRAYLAKRGSRVA